MRIMYVFSHDDIQKEIPYVRVSLMEARKQNARCTSKEKGLMFVHESFFLGGTYERSNARNPRYY